MLVAIVMTVCLQAGDGSCREERIEFDGSPMACVIDAQPIVAEWGGDHPDWRIKSWTCSRG